MITSLCNMYVDLEFGEWVSQADGSKLKEADGDRIVIYCKLLMVIFRQQGHSKEAFHFISDITLSPKQAMDLKCSCTVNTHGRPCRSQHSMCGTFE